MIRKYKFRKRIGEGFEYFEVDTAKHDQFTGLLDRNGREIYEGDILQKPGDVAKWVVMFGKYQGFCQQHEEYGYYAKMINPQKAIVEKLGITFNDMDLIAGLFDCNCLIEEAEVVGNIYELFENPELWKHKEKREREDKNAKNKI